METAHGEYLARNLQDIFFSQKSKAITQNLLDLESHSGFNKYPSSQPVAYSHQFGLLLGHLSDISNKFLAFTL